MLTGNDCRRSRSGATDRPQRKDNRPGHAESCRLSPERVPMKTNPSPSLVQPFGNKCPTVPATDL